MKTKYIVSYSYIDYLGVDVLNKEEFRSFVKALFYYISLNKYDCQVIRFTKEIPGRFNKHIMTKTGEIRANGFRKKIEDIR